jgi:hypothetical protein
MRRYCCVILSGMLLSLSGCITEATVELTKAPFDATTALTDGTSKAVGEFLDPTTEFTSSTTPGTSTGNQLMKARRKTEVFAASSYENLRTNFARGSGEYLVSLATLAGVPQDRQSEFQERMRDTYPTIFQDSLTLRESTTHIVEAAWSAGYGAKP